MSWLSFIYFAIPAILFWAVGAFLAWKERRPLLVYGFTAVGLIFFFSFITLMWVSLERPPLRTMGETRLWYSFFLPLAGIIVYSRWKYKWILAFSTLLSTVFIYLFKPEIHNKTLMPALQSPWFAPHVIIYMFAYALLGAAALMSIYLLFFKRLAVEEKEIELTDNLSYIGLAFMTIGMLFGALLELGPERNLGGYHMVQLSRLYSFSPFQSSPSAHIFSYVACLLCFPSSMLVGYQLFTQCSRQ